jgi:hypothetical protein
MKKANPLHIVNTGLQIQDVREDKAFAARQLHSHSPEAQVMAMRRLVRSVLNSDESVLQTLVDMAVELCGADSAGLSLVLPNATDALCHRWVATSGKYTPFMGADLPRYPSACGVSLELGGPQHFRFEPEYFEILGIEAQPIADGITLPWYVDDLQGTLFILSHQRHEAFDLRDCQMMELLSDFAALAIRQRRHQDKFLKEAAHTSAKSMLGNDSSIAANPLQALIHVLYMTEGGVNTGSEHLFGFGSGDQMQPLSKLADKMLAIPYPTREFWEN